MNLTLGTVTLKVLLYFCGPYFQELFFYYWNTYHTYPNKHSRGAFFKGWGWGGVGRTTVTDNKQFWSTVAMGNSDRHFIKFKGPEQTFCL